MEQLDPHWRDFREISYFSIFRKSVEKLSSFITIGQELWVPEDRCTFFIISCAVLLRMRNVSGKGHR